MVPGLLLLSLLPAATAVEPTADWTLSAAGFAAGVETTIAAGLRQPLWNREGDLLRQETYLQGQGLLTLTPAYLRAGVELAFQPATVFELRLGYATVAWFGTFSAILPYQDPGGEYDAEARQGRDRTHGTSQRLWAQPTLRAKVGPVVGIGSTTIRWEAVDPARYDEDLLYWYHAELSVLVGRQDWAFDHNGLLLLELPSREAELYLGPYLTSRQALATGDSMMRLGPAAILRLDEGRWTVYALAQAWLSSRSFDRPLPPFIASRVAWHI